jgi:hypothetical protein
VSTEPGTGQADKHGLQERKPTLAASAEHTPDQPTGASEEPNPNFQFVCGLPNSGSQMLANFTSSQGYELNYFEHPKTLGEAHGVPSPYECPQVIVVFNEENDPFLIVRSEQNPSGTLFLCSLDAKGAHTNWGPISQMSRDDFAKQANKIITQIKYETASVAPKEDEVSTLGRAATSGGGQIGSDLEKHILQERRSTQAARPEHTPDQPTKASEEHKHDVRSQMTDPFEKTITKLYGFLADTAAAEIQSKLDAERAILWKSGDEKYQEMVLSQCVDELDRLVRHGADPAVKVAFHDRMRRIDPKLEERVSTRQSAEMHEPLTPHELELARMWKSGDEDAKEIVVFNLAADLHKLFRTTTASGYEKGKATYLARIRRIDPELEKLVSARHSAEMEERVSAQQSAEMHEHLADDGLELARMWKSGDEDIKKIVVSNLAADLHRLFCNSASHRNGGYEAAKEAYLARIRRIDPELASRVSLRHHYELETLYSID